MMKNLLERVVIAYNGSQSSFNAVLYGILLSKQFKLSLKVVYVVDSAAITMLTLNKFMVSAEGENIRQRLLQEGERDLEYVKTLARSKGVKIETEVREGAVSSELLTAASEFKADLILVGASSSTDSKSRINGSLSRQKAGIIADAPCSVMVVKKDDVKKFF